MMRLNVLTIVSLILVIVGALNWGLVGLFSFDLVAALFGDMSGASRAVYTLVGIAGVVLLIAWLTARRTRDAAATDHTATRGAGR